MINNNTQIIKGNKIKLNTTIYQITIPPNYKRFQEKTENLIIASTQATNQVVYKEGTVLEAQNTGEFGNILWKRRSDGDFKTLFDIAIKLIPEWLDKDFGIECHKFDFFEIEERESLDLT